MIEAIAAALGILFLAAFVLAACSVILVGAVYLCLAIYNEIRDEGWIKR